MVEKSGIIVNFIFAYWRKQPLIIIYLINHEIYLRGEVEVSTVEGRK